MPKAVYPPELFLRMGRAARVLFPTIGILATAATFAAVDFQKEIAPIFAEHCMECHGPNKVKGGLNLTTRDGAYKELKSGAVAVIPGNPEKSELLARLVTDDEEEMMPPRKKTKRPKPEEIARVRAWIAEGAPWGEHWAYVPVKRENPPAVKNVAWVQNAIDAFILSRLEAQGIAPSPEADRPTLIKRVHYD